MYCMTFPTSRTELASLRQVGSIALWVSVSGVGLVYRGTSLIRNSAPLGPYSRNMPRALWWSWGGGLFLMSEVPLYAYLVDGGNLKPSP